MHDIIIVNFDKQTTSGRQLHNVLNIETPYSMWFKRMTEYGFCEGTDFVTEVLESTGGRPSENHEITIEMAKEIAMLQRTEEGRKVRQYFIELEKKWNTPEVVMARALQVANNTLSRLQSDIQVLLPKAEFYDAVAGSKDALPIGQAAKVLNVGIGQNNLFKILREKKILQQDNIPYQEYIDRGYFRTIEQKFTAKGETRIYIKTLVYQKGLDYIRKLLTAG